MTKEWMKIIIAALFEVGWVVGLKHSNTWWEWIATGIAVYISFYVLIKAGEKLPVGTVYTVFVGLGTSGVVLVDILVFNEPFTFMTILLIGLLMAGTIGLKMSSDEKGKGESN
jgi:paired small multidrug resistance pump